MKKIILFLCFGLSITSPCFASPLDHFSSQMTKKLEKATDKLSRDPDEEGYTDFSGSWTGTCDNDPDYTETFDIKTTVSSIMIDGENYDIDAVMTKGMKNNINFQEKVIHFHWSEDGSQLSATILLYTLSGYMAAEKMSTLIGNLTLSMENNQLVTRISGHYSVDGIPMEGLDINTTCTYTRQEAKKI